MSEYVESRHIAKAVIRKRVLPATALPPTKEYRYIEPMASGLFNTADWDPEKGKRARAKSVEERQKRARERARVSKEKNHPHKVWKADDITDVKKMRDDGATWKVIAEKYGVSDTAVKKAIQRYGKEED